METCQTFNKPNYVIIPYCTLKNIVIYIIYIHRYTFIIQATKFYIYILYCMYVLYICFTQRLHKSRLTLSLHDAINLFLLYGRNFGMFCSHRLITRSFAVFEEHCIKRISRCAGYWFNVNRQNDFAQLFS